MMSRFFILRRSGRQSPALLLLAAVLALLSLSLFTRSTADLLGRLLP